MDPNSPTHSSSSHHDPSGLSPKRIRQRVSRACDGCRKNKVKCLINEGENACKSCVASCRSCTFEAVGVKREKPPTKRDIKQLNAKIQLLENILGIIAPLMDLNTLPRTADQARSMVNHMISKTKQQVTQNEEHCQSPKLDFSKQHDISSALSLLANLRITSEGLDAPDQSPGSPSHYSVDAVSESDHLLEDLSHEISRSTFEITLDNYLNLGIIDKHRLPPDDLATPLLDIFFQKINPYECILHRGEFMKHYHNGLHNRDRSFRGLTFAVFAAASRFSSDERVIPHSEDVPHNRQAAGASFLYASVQLITITFARCTLHELQAMALLCYITCSSCSPLTAWFSTCSYLRRAQSVGAHLEKTQAWKTSIMIDQLRKRAVWHLASKEQQLCMCLGRTSCLKNEPLTLDFPFCIDDETLSGIISAEANQSPSSAFVLKLSDLESLPSTTCQVSMRLLCVVRQRFGLPLQKLFCVKRNSEAKEDDLGSSEVADLAIAIENFHEHIPENLKWSPDLADAQDLVLSARLNCTLLSMQIFMHRLLINEAPSEIHACLKAASKLIGILDVIRSRGLLESTVSWTPYLVTQPALTLLLVARCKHDCMVSLDRANAWAGVHQCINILNALAPTTFIAERLCESLTQLVQACIEEELFPAFRNDAESIKKRGMTEVSDVKPKESLTATTVTTTETDSSVKLDLNDTCGSSVAPLTAPTETERVEATAKDEQSSSGGVYLSSEELFNLLPSQLDATLFEYPGKTLVPGISNPLGLPEWLGYITPSDTLLTCEPDCYDKFEKPSGGLIPGELGSFDPIEFFGQIDHTE